MIGTPLHDPILLLHSSCTGHNEGEASFKEDLTAKNDTRSDSSILQLLKEQVFCDLLLLPEHPSSRNSQPDYLHLQENPLNPCGIANVLTLEKLPQNWISGPILLSLSSCNIFYRKSEEDEFTSQTPIIVEPIPSTFVLDFSSNQDVGDQADEGKRQRERRNSSIVTVQSMAEIFVAFDVREASIQAKELLRHENSTRINAIDDKGESRLEDHLKDYSNSHQGNKDKIDKGTETKGAEDDLFYHDHPHTFEDQSYNLNFHTLSSSQDLKEQALMIAHLNVQLDQGTQTIDVVLFMSVFFCIVSMTTLLWAIYQHYRTTLKSDMFSEEIRECMTKTHDMLQNAVNEFSQHRNQKAKRRNSISDKLSSKGQKNCNGETKTDQFSSQDNASGKNSRSQNVASALASHRNEKVEHEGPHPTTPTRDNEVVNTRTQDISSEGMIIDERKVYGKSLDKDEVETQMEFPPEQISKPVQITDVPTSIQEEGEKKLCFLKFATSLREHSFGTPYDSPPHNLMKGLSNGKILDLKMNEETEINDEMEITPSPYLQHSNNCDDSAPLSPCSKLEKEWNEGKTVRRCNLKKKRQFLTPIFQSSAEPPPTSTSKTWKDDGGKSLFESTILSRVPKTSKLYDRYCQQQELSCDILPPPKLRSTARVNNMEENEMIRSSLIDQSAKDHEAVIGRNAIDGVKTPPFDMTLQKVPRLCHTPASEDNSFVDDYW